MHSFNDKFVPVPIKIFHAESNIELDFFESLCNVTADMMSCLKPSCPRDVFPDRCLAGILGACFAENTDLRQIARHEPAKA